MRGHLGWIIDLLMSVYPEPTLAVSPCRFCLSLLNTALGLLLSVWNGNEPSYFWALLCICRQTYRPLLWFTQAGTLFCTKRARYLRWDESAFIYCKRGEKVWALKLLLAHERVFLKRLLRWCKQGQVLIKRTKNTVGIRNRADKSLPNITTHTHTYTQHLTQGHQQSRQYLPLQH